MIRLAGWLKHRNSYANAPWGLLHVIRLAGWLKHRNSYTNLAQHRQASQLGRESRSARQGLRLGTKAKHRHSRTLPSSFTGKGILIRNFRDALIPQTRCLRSDLDSVLDYVLNECVHDDLANASLAILS